MVFKRYPAGIGVVEAHEQVDYRGFSRSCRSYDCSCRSGSDVHHEVVDYLMLGVVAEINVLRVNLSGDEYAGLCLVPCEYGSVIVVGALFLFVKETENSLCRRCR